MLGFSVSISALNMATEPQASPPIQQTPSSNTVQAAARLLNDSRRVIAFTGAGMSRDSGISVFRNDPTENPSLWSGITGRLALLYFGTPLGWNLTPSLALKMYKSRFLGPMKEAKAHEGHHVIARICNGGVVTMNVDRLHEMGGCDPSSVVHVHGIVDEYFCMKCGEDSSDGVCCDECGRGRVRPKVVLFWEELNREVLGKARRMMEGLGSSDCVVVVGTSGVVFPAAGLPALAKARGAKIVEVGYETGRYNGGGADVSVIGGAEKKLAEIWSEMERLRSRAVGDESKDTYLGLRNQYY
eukprot:Plantae.Rhodophyta-Hildenbrandia_rubra.ctg20688.p1 GENE.Plantae.Rhodophyta-Hildenbrandia_rubra.ctg20688~~Plantae.Rhodophyta-Hildenbrandia_rubra.ctg20688.p1  ORF type:complete len:299 (+),score=58.18 Plantae.Rhodophyta-Hildenbrandia_rubra.ctg20688:1108-2004(+)